MKVVSTYKCLNCGAEKKIEHDVEERRVLQRTANPSITGVQWDSFSSANEGHESKIGVYTENNGLLKLDPIKGHVCNEDENVIGIMQLVRVQPR